MPQSDIPVFPDNPEDLSLDALAYLTGSSSTPDHVRRSVKIDFRLRSNTPEMEGVIELIIEMMRDKECRIGNLRKLSLHLNVLLSNLLKTHNDYTGYYTGYSRDKNNYHARYLGPGIGFRPMKNGVNGLVNLEFAENIPGINRGAAGSGYVSRIKASDSLLKLMSDHYVDHHSIELIDIEPELIILRNGNSDINYRDNERTNEMREHVRRYNEFLNTTEITVALSAPPTEFNKENKNIRRIFNNASFEQGGRFYGGWWQAQKTLRPFVMINGSPTVELDFEALVAHQTYSAMGLSYNLSEDPYVIHGIDLPRKFGKDAFYRMLNTPSRGDALHSIDGIGQPTDGEYIEAEAIATSIEEKHAHISEQFFSNPSLGKSVV